LNKILTEPPELLFPKQFDYVVFGAGYIGFSTALRLAGRKHSVLLLATNGQLLWESTAALENRVTNQCGNKAWIDWLEQLKTVDAIHGSYLDPAGAEILAAQRLSSQTEQHGIESLLYAVPVAANKSQGQTNSITVATKSGLQRIESYHWIDCSENADLLRIIEPGAFIPARSRTSTWRFALQSDRWELIEPNLQALTRKAGMELIGSAKNTERHLVWLDDGDAWKESLVKNLKWLRKSLPEGSGLPVSHCGTCAYPSYSSTEESSYSGSTNNLTVLSPVLFTDRSITTIEDRFLLGSTAMIPETNRKIDRQPEEYSEIRIAETITCEVLIAGTGTSGSIAAITSANEGAGTLAIDYAKHPGGVGTGGGITGYFFGISGGIQTRVDQLTDEMTKLLTGRTPKKDSWHQDAKKLAILQMFRQHRVQFKGGLLLCTVDKEENRVTAVYTANERGLIKIQSKAYVDCTGDGDLCAHAGSAFTTGREGDGRNLAYSQAALALDRADSEITTSTLNYDAGWLDPTSSIDLTRARLSGIALYTESDALKKRELLTISPMLGIRQSRQIITDYSLQLNDLVSGRKFEDTIGEAGCHADSHSVDFEFENDEMVFFYWACRLFRYPLRTQLPYRMLLPKDLTNVWIACRAAGMSTNAFYAIRMQRDMQRLGEIAGIAAAQCTSTDERSNSRHANLESLRIQASSSESQLDNYGILPADDEDPISCLQAGRSGLALWRIYQQPDTYREATIKLLDSDTANTTFYAACALAMWNHPSAEARLIHAVRTREVGAINPAENTGAYGQEIDIPFWLLAIILLRRCGTSACIPVIENETQNPQHRLNVKTSIALTLERLHRAQILSDREVLALTEALIQSPTHDQSQVPSRSLARAIRKEPQISLPNRSGADVKEDHIWQLHLIVCRIQSAAGSPSLLATAYQNDPRIHVRNRFRPYCIDQSPTRSQPILSP
tara:strand:- start:63 stop:2933 length:2871 start_codon:yes stop_codon:yes gene_type:complete